MNDYQARLGKETAEGRKWPALDAAGFPYEREAATVQGIGNGHFIVRPINWNDPVTEAALRAAAAGLPVEPLDEAEDILEANDGAG
jgi:hypothetical protein